MKSVASMLIRSLPWAAVACTLSSAAAAAPTFQITVVPSLGVHEGCTPHAINDLGQITGDCSQRAFFWTPEDGTVEIPGPGADSYLSAWGLNNHGVVAAELHRFDGSRFDGVLWDSTNGVRIFTPPDVERGEVHGINDAGTVVGFGWVPIAPSTPPHAFFWTETTGVVDPWPEFVGFTDIRSINEQGQMLLWAIDEQGQKPWLLDGNGSFEALNMSFCPTGDGQGTRLNDLSQVVGVCVIGPITSHAAVWLTPSGGRDIDRRPEGKGSSHAWDINNNGQVVGLWNGGGHNGYPRWETSFYWDAETRMIGLHRLLDPADPLAAVTYLGPTSVINDVGQIATAGTVDGEWQMLLLTPISDE